MAALEARRGAVVVSLLVFIAAPGRQAGAADGSDDVCHVVLHSNLGDVVIQLSSTASEETLRAFIQGVRDGGWDRAAVVRIQAGAAVEIAMPSPSSEGNAPKTRGDSMGTSPSVRPLGIERGCVALKRRVDDGNVVWSLLMFIGDDVSQRDADAQPIGTVENDEDLFAEFAAVPRDKTQSPRVPITVESVEVYESQREFLKAQIVKPHPVEGTESRRNEAYRAIDLVTATVWCLVVCSGAAIICLWCGAVGYGAALNLTVMFASTFVLLVVLLPEGQRSPWLGAALLVVVAGVLRALNRFEVAR